MSNKDFKFINIFINEFSRCVDDLRINLCMVEVGGISFTLRIPQYPDLLNISLSEIWSKKL